MFKLSCPQINVKADTDDDASLYCNRPPFQLKMKIRAKNGRLFHSARFVIGYPHSPYK